jgi:hypothetical protein
MIILAFRTRGGAADCHNEPTRLRAAGDRAAISSPRTEMTSKRILADEFLDWSKQRREEIKAALTGLGDQADSLNAEARQQADLAIARIRAVRADFEAKISVIMPGSASAKTVSENAFADIAADWTEARAALRQFFAAAAGQTTAVRKALAGVAQSQRPGEPAKFASTVNGSAATTARISCVVCAYNEADRIRRILEAVHNHPALAEVIVVNDGSTDDTEAILSDYPAIRAISYMPNRGKTYALTRGIAAATGDYLMFLDADLAGVNAGDIQALAEPVIGGRAEVSISLRRNSLAPYRWIGLDFVSGERVIPAQLLDQAVKEMEHLPRWGCEAFINDLIIEKGLSVAVVDWPTVFNTPKTAKRGAWQGVVGELEMIRDAVGFLSPMGVVRQNLALLMLVRRDSDAYGAGAAETERPAP